MSEETSSVPPTTTEIGKRKRISDSKCDDVLHHLRAKNRHTQHKESLEWIASQLKNDPDRTEDVRLYLQQRLTRLCGEDRLPRCCRRLEDVPQKLVRRAIQDLMRYQKHLIADISKDDLPKLFAFACRSSVKLKLPEKNMTYQAFLEWYFDLTTPFQEQLQSVDLALPECSDASGEQLLPMTDGQLASKRTRATVS